MSGALRARKKGTVSTPAVSPTNPRTNVDARSKKEREFYALALQLGFTVYPLVEMKRFFASEIACRMQGRRGVDIYQSIAFNLPYTNLELPQSFLPQSLLMSQVSASTWTWKLTSLKEMVNYLGPVMDRVDGTGGRTIAAVHPAHRVLGG